MVTVHNRMTDMAVDFVFEALAAPSGKRQSANKAAASPSFMWLGCTTRSIKGLAAGSSVHLPVRAAFLRAGVYDLNRFRFVVHMAANSAQLVPGIVGSRLKLLSGNLVRVPYIFSAQYIIKVETDGMGEETCTNYLTPPDAFDDAGLGVETEVSGGRITENDDPDMVMLVEPQVNEATGVDGLISGSDSLFPSSSSSSHAMVPPTDVFASGGAYPPPLSAQPAASVPPLPSDILEGIVGESGTGGMEEAAMEEITPSIDVIGSPTAGLGAGEEGETGGGDLLAERQRQQEQQVTQDDDVAEVEVGEDQSFGQKKAAPVEDGAGEATGGQGDATAVYPGVGEGMAREEESEVDTA